MGLLNQIRKEHKPQITPMSKTKRLIYTTRSMYLIKVNDNYEAIYAGIKRFGWLRNYT
jgi:hypothetical protein